MNQNIRLAAAILACSLLPHLALAASGPIGRGRGSGVSIVPGAAASLGGSALGSVPGLTPLVPLQIPLTSGLQPALPAPGVLPVSEAPQIPSVAEAAIAPLAVEAPQAIAAGGVARSLANPGAPASGGSGSSGGGGSGLDLKRQKMLQTLMQIAAVFADQYAPIDWKKEQFEVDLRREHAKAEAAILSRPGMTTPEFQDAVAAFVASMRDYHVGVSFASTERARLPLLIMRAGDTHVIAYVDRDKLPEEEFPFKVGDEVVEFGGRPTAEVVQELAARLGGNTRETDLRLAEMFLTNRRRARGDQVPQGSVDLKIRDAKGAVHKIQLAWEYKEEQVPQNVPVRDGGLFSGGAKPGSGPLSGFDDSIDSLRQKGRGLRALLGRFYAQAVHPLTQVFAGMRNDDAANPFMIGAKKSYVPELGEIIWQAKDDAHFHAYIFKAKDGRKVGFVRIADYGGGREQVEEFGRLMARFQKMTDALVIDQVGNPGGAIFYLYALASHLSAKPLAAPKHRLIIEESDALWASGFLEIADNPLVKLLAKLDLGDEWAGYPVTEGFWQLLKQFARFIIAELAGGRRLTNHTHLWGVDSINPAPKARQRYTKPILLLTNALDFSGGDFFPAILQDNKRAKVLGVRTAGAGGAVKSYSLPNQFGIGDLYATWTLAQRANGRPIENLGVEPDVQYDLMPQDFRTGFAEYRRTILKALGDLLR